VIGLHFESHVQFVPANELVEPGIPDSELGPQGFQEMSDSKQAAEVAAFRALGWKIAAQPTGAIINGVVAPSPARTAGLHVADEIVAVDGQAVRSTAGSSSWCIRLSRAPWCISAFVGRISRSGDITLRDPTAVKLTTGRAPSDLGATGCAGVNGPIARGSASPLRMATATSCRPRSPSTPPTSAVLRRAWP